MRLLFVDARGGASVRNLLASLLDLGVAPSPLLRGVADLGLPVELHLEPGRVERIPPEDELLVSPLDVEDLLAPLAADAVGRLVVEELRGDALAALVDGGALAMLHAVALALDDLAPDRVLVSHVGPATPDARALLDALSPEGAGAREPEWSGYVARGRARAAPHIPVALGNGTPAGQP